MNAQSSRPLADLLSADHGDSRDVGREHSLLSPEHEAEVAALWRLLRAASDAFPPEADKAASAETENLTTTATTLAGLVSDMTLKMAPEAREKVAGSVEQTRFLNPDLSLGLAFDTDLAGLSFVARSPALKSGQIYHLIFEGAEATQAAVARRRDLTAEHIDALIGRPGQVIAWQLLKNRALRFTPAQIEALTRRGLKYPALRLPLIERPEFGEPEAMLLMHVVGPDLKAALKSRFPNLDMSFPVTSGISAVQAPVLERTDTAFLVHCLARGVLATYARGVAQRLSLDAGVLLEALKGPSLVPLALTLAALGVDRAVFNGVIKRYAVEKPSGYERLARSIFALPKAEAEARLKSHPDFFKATSGDLR